jgi:hypothetical protein
MVMVDRGDCLFSMMAFWELQALSAANTNPTAMIRSRMYLLIGLGTNAGIAALVHREALHIPFLNHGCHSSDGLELIFL